MANIFIESHNYPQKHPIPLFFFKKATRQILQRIYSEEVLVPNLNEIKNLLKYWRSYLFIQMFSCRFAARFSLDLN